MRCLPHDATEAFALQVVHKRRDHLDVHLLSEGAICDPKIFQQWASVEFAWLKLNAKWFLQLLSTANIFLPMILFLLSNCACTTVPPCVMILASNATVASMTAEVVSSQASSAKNQRYIKDKWQMTLLKEVVFSDGYWICAFWKKEPWFDCSFCGFTANFFSRKVT